MAKSKTVVEAQALAGKADSVVQDFAAKGFAALDAPRDLTGVKTHFLRLEVRDGQYHLESRSAERRGS